jgi:hypothetical protein
MKLNHSDDYQYVRMQHFHSKRLAAQRFIHSIAGFNHCAIADFAELFVSSFFLFQFNRFNALLTIESFTNISNSSQTNQHISFRYACDRCFKYFSNSISWNWLSLQNLCFIIKMNAIISSKCVQLNLTLYLTKTDLNDNQDDLIEVLLYKTQRDCLSQNITKRWRHAWFDLIWSDLIWFDLIWFHLIWFDRSTSIYNIYDQAAVSFSYELIDIQEKFSVCMRNFKKLHLKIWLMNLMKIKLESRELDENQKMIENLIKINHTVDSSLRWWYGSIAVYCVFTDWEEYEVLIAT